MNSPIAYGQVMCSDKAYSVDIQCSYFLFRALRAKAYITCEPTIYLVQATDIEDPMELSGVLGRPGQFEYCVLACDVKSGGTAS